MQRPLQIDKSIAVLIPTFNRADTLLPVLRSVLNQTLEPETVIVVDDGSEDATENVTRAFLSRHQHWSNKVKLIRQENHGKSSALNTALTEVECEWIAFNDSDDLWLPTKLEDQFRALEQFPECKACLTNCEYINNTDMQYSSFSRSRHSYADVGVLKDPMSVVTKPPHGFYMQSLVVRADVMREVGGFDRRLPVAADTDIIFRIAQHTPFCVVNKMLVQIDRTPIRSTALTGEHPRKGMDRMLESVYLFEKWLLMVRSDRVDIRNSILDLYRRQLEEIAKFHLLSGDRNAAKNFFDKARPIGSNSIDKIKLGCIEALPWLYKIVRKLRA